MPSIYDNFVRIISIVPMMVHSWMVARGFAYPMQRECEKVVEWALERLPADTDAELVLPGDLAILSRNGVVQAIQGSQGRTCVLLKREIKWKDNFTATLYCNMPIATEEILRGQPPYADFISIRNSTHFRELYVAKQLNDNWFRVYFDLN